MSDASESLQFTSRAWCFGDNVPTDEIVPTRWVFETMSVIRQHMLENLKPEFASEVQPGDIVVAGEHFGQSSGRAVAAKVLKAAGVSCIVAHSFARTFLRNCYEIGLPILECPLEGVADGHELTADIVDGTVRNTTTGEQFAGRPTDAFLLTMLRAGGLIPLVRAEGAGLGIKAA